MGDMGGARQGIAHRKGKQPPRFGHFEDILSHPGRALRCADRGAVVPMRLTAQSNLRTSPCAAAGVRRPSTPPGCTPCTCSHPALRPRPLGRTATMTSGGGAPRRAVAAAPAAARHAHLPDPAGFAAPDAPSFAVAIMGDLHLSPDPSGLPEFEAARAQLVDAATSLSPAARIVQLGDLGAYDAGWPGSRACFAVARSFLDGFGLPVALITGNHDLEAAEMETDEENLAAWQEAFGQRHFWAADLGPATVVGLSTVRFRSNPFSVHEVHIDAEQMAFLEATLEKTAAAGRPVVICTHAPAMGSGLKVIQSVHVKNRCAWLNHSSDPGAFARLLARHPHVKLWFSGHFHLSQSYPDSVSRVGGTAFVLTGVIGDHSSRDGLHHSRLLTGDAQGFEVYTIDHDSGERRLDLRGRWADPGPPEYLVPSEDLLCDPSEGWLCSEVDCSLGGAGPAPEKGAWLNVGPAAMLSLQGDVLVEYDVASMAPIGAVFLNVPEGAEVRLVDAAGGAVDGVATDGAAAVAVELVDPVVGAVVARAERNAAGTFYQIFQANKWVARKKKEAEEAARAAAAAGASA